ncbi:uncharacterized mitochondrial protein-like protein [Tanacetum coccineum]
MCSDTKLTKNEEGESMDSTKYRGMISSLLYLTESRSDIMFSVCLCARFQEDPKTSHLEMLKRIFRYIKGTTHLGLWYSKETNIETIVYADSDHARDYVDRKSTSGVFYFHGMLFNIVVFQETNETFYLHYRSRIQDVADKDSDSIPVDLDPLTIVLASCHKLLDAAVRSTATSCPLLESLDMSNFLCVSDETLREIALICGHLHILNASLLMLTVLKLHSYEGITSASMAATSHSYMLEPQSSYSSLEFLSWFLVELSLIDQGTWVIVELSHVRAPNTYRRLPSGCLIEHITGDVSKVTWVEHMEVDEPLPNRSGFACAAERMVAWLERSCERGSDMNATCRIIGCRWKLTRFEKSLQPFVQQHLQSYKTESK